MTTAARPTFDPARGKASQAPTRIYSSRDLASHTKLKFRQTGQTTQDELNRVDLKAQLKKAEQDHYEKVNKVAKFGAGLSNSFKDDNDDDADQDQRQQEAAETSTESPLERKRRLLKEAERLDKDDSDDSDASKDSDDSDSDSDSDDEDDTAELLRELEKIKRERAEEKERQERIQREEEERAREAQAATGNPLLEMPEAAQSGAPKDFSVKRRWDEDVIFKNQARGMDDKPKKRFINDTLRSDFHRKFMSKYVQ
ncbi:hypothetical protein BGX24_010126 [Mortierella sp. AD032]|nr:hypothetical protein BGX24_010126 [Mortierella sp. AD032]